jgi:PhnB protein
MRFDTYLFFNGQCEEAFTFYAQCFGGKIDAMFPHEGTPAAAHVPADWQKKIMHARLTIGDSVLMGSDAHTERFERPQGFSISISLDDPAETERIFNALVEGGKTVMPLGQTFWAFRFGMCVDRFGIPWMLNCEKPA